MLRKSKYTNPQNFKKLLEKVSGLFEKGHKSCLCFDLDGVSILGQYIEKFKINKNGLSFVFKGKEYKINLSEIYKIKRLRSRKYKFYTGREASRAQLKEALKGGPAPKLERLTPKREVKVEEKPPVVEEKAPVVEAKPEEKFEDIV